MEGSIEYKRNKQASEFLTAGEVHELKLWAETIETEARMIKETIGFQMPSGICSLAICSLPNIHFYTERLREKLMNIKEVQDGPTKTNGESAE